MPPARSNGQLEALVATTKGDEQLPTEFVGGRRQPSHCPPGTLNSRLHPTPEKLRASLGAPTEHRQAEATP